MGLIEDPNDDARSLMYRAPSICDGEATGVPCVHFWPVIQKFRAQNASAIRSGDKRYNCTMAPSFLLEWTSEEKPTYCGRYEPKKLPGLRALVQRAVANALFLKPGQGPSVRIAVGSHEFNIGLAGGGYATFDKEFGVFKPMTPEEIEQLRKDMPDRPVAWGSPQFGKDPTQWHAEDISGGEQINIVPRNADGTQTPLQVGLSAEIEAAMFSPRPQSNPTADTRPEGLLTPTQKDES